MIATTVRPIAIKSSSTVSDSAVFPVGYTTVSDMWQTKFERCDVMTYRTHEEMRAVIKQAGMKIIKEELQQGFPPSLFAVPMIAFR